ncbi:aminotransferase class V-fold PLP-dependent enzyme, partial [Patescibacteria group bacterium]|nr:aminotransferase class V-fold PLP-dependent enzyme [Patescibacteria group bacterium]
PIRLPISGPQDVVAQVTDAFPTDGSVAYSVFDHVTSNTGIVMPIKQLVDLAHSRGSKVLVDGAHGLQSQDLDLSALGPDWYTSNCHKWFCSAKGVAFLYASPEVRSATSPAIISHGYGDGFTSGFLWDGTRDYSGMISLPALLSWWDVLGHEKSRGYCRTLLKDAVKLLTGTWGTDTHVPMSCYSHMACVALPTSSLPPGSYSYDDPENETQPKFHATSTHSKMIQDTLHYKYKIECPVKTLNSRCYLRISAAIYNCIEDYQKLSDAILEIKWD